MLVYVQDKNGRLLMPIKRFGAVRRWLKSGRARIVRREPFTIRLLDRNSGYTQRLKAGVDLGTAHVGVSVVSDKQEVFAGEFKLRTDVSRLLTERRIHRRNRRYRKCRHRPPRFLNRKRKDELAPSVRAKVDETLKVVRLVESILPVHEWIFEIANFDLHRLANPDVSGEDYQQGEQYGFENVREYVLWRDRHTCQNPKCDHTDPVLTIHHIQQRMNCGSNRPANLITLCRTCHLNYHKGQPLDLKVPESVRGATQLNIVKSYIMRATTHLNRTVTFGYITKANRTALGLPKTHIQDAFVIAGRGKRHTRARVNYLGIFFRRQNRKLFKGAHSHIRNTVPQVNGFKRWDRVCLADRSEGIIYGLRSSGYFDVRRLDGTVLSHAISHRALRRVEGARTLCVERVAEAKGDGTPSCC
jgi:hypothetical protein